MMFNVLSRSVVATAAISGLLFGASIASAATFTSVANTANFGYERCLTGSGSGSITSGGGDVCGVGAKSNYYNGGLSIAQLVANDISTQHGGEAITLSRVDDGNPDSSLFTYLAGPNPTQVEGRARYAGNGNSFGIFAGTSGGSFTSVLGPITKERVFLDSNSTFGDANVRHDIVLNAALTGTLLPALADGSFFRPAIQGPGGAYTFTSLIADNPGLLDHLVAYKITGIDLDREALGIFSYLLGFEDAGGSLKSLGDADYNDFVVQLDFSAVRVPEPSTLALLGGGLAVFIFGWRRRKVAQKSA